MDTFLINELASRFKREEEGLFSSDAAGYWSNLDTAENRDLISLAQSKPARDALREKQPQLEDIVYSPMRPAGLELLDLRGNETCIDYGCMWGALTIPLSKRTRQVLAIDQTMESLRFLKARLKESQCDNVVLLNHDLRTLPTFTQKTDVAIVNGVLEWIPEEGKVELKHFFGQRMGRSYNGDPGALQLSFLRKVCENLSDRGKLYLAIENRFDYKMFFGAKDPHANLRFTTVVPRKVANWISHLRLGRPYVNWVYSVHGLKHLLREAGFKQIDLYMCFPDYRYPERIIPFSHSLKGFTPPVPSVNGQSSLRRQVVRGLQYIFFRYLRLKGLAPSLIAVAHK